jgi:hypothetical protein
MGMGYSVYFMLGMLALVLMGLVILIVRGGRTRKPPA